MYVHTHTYRHIDMYICIHTHTDRGSSATSSCGATHAVSSRGLEELASEELTCEVSASNTKTSTR